MAPSSSSPSTDDSTSNRVQNVASYQNPILAALRGKAVKLIATGDMPGHSPVCQYIDHEGRIDWASQSEFVIVDPTFLPPTPDSLAVLNKIFSSR